MNGSWKSRILARLAIIADEVLQNNEYFRKAAREKAESRLGLDIMVDAYLKVLLNNE